jgi:hypothetical protein
MVEAFKPLGIDLHALPSSGAAAQEQDNGKPRPQDQHSNDGRVHEQSRAHGGTVDDPGGARRPSDCWRGAANHLCFGSASLRYG